MSPAFFQFHFCVHKRRPSPCLRSSRTRRMGIGQGFFFFLSVIFIQVCCSWVPAYNQALTKPRLSGNPSPQGASSPTWVQRAVMIVLWWYSKCLVWFLEKSLKLASLVDKSSDAFTTLFDDKGWRRLLVVGYNFIIIQMLPVQFSIS